MPKISPCLWFDQQAEEAAKFYVSVFKKNSRILQVTYYGDTGPMPKGTVLTVVFRLDGQEFMALNGGPQFKFTPALSLIVYCKTQREVDYYWKKLSKGGKTVQCGWLEDKYGLSWQIAPANLPKLLDAKTPERANRVLAAVCKMVKLDLKKLEKAYAGK